MPIGRSISNGIHVALDLWCNHISELIAPSSCSVF